METIKEIENTLRSHKQDLFTRYPLKSLAIFGSYAKNQYKEDSDVDVMVEFNDKIGIRFIDLADEIEDIVGKKVDLVSRKGIKEKYFKAIQSDLIYV